MTEPAAPTSPIEMGPKLRIRGGKSYYQARLSSNGQPVIIMRMGSTYRKDPIAEKRMRREFAAARRVSSPYVLRYLALLEDPAHGPALVMEAEKGGPLRAHLAVHGGQPLEQALALMVQLSEGLLACHRAGVVHRDISPDTIQFAGDTVYLSDFGLSYFEQATALTMTGTMLQSPEYAPPESFVGTSHDLRGDVYSAGVVFWELLVGRSPFEGQPLFELLESKKAPLQFASAIEPTCPAWLDLLLTAMTAPAPEDRPSSFVEVLEALKNRTYATPSVSSGKGRCMHCGRDLLRCTTFCVACGEERDVGGQSGDVTLLITNVNNVEATAHLLESTFPGTSLLPLRKTLQNRRVFLGTNFTPAEASWLEKRLCDLGVASVTQSTHSVFEKLAWFFGGAILLLFLLTAATLQTSWSLDIPQGLDKTPKMYFPFINLVNLVLALAMVMLFATLGQYRLSLRQLLMHGWHSLRETLQAGPKVLGISFPGVLTLLAKTTLALFFVWLALSTIVQLCSLFALVFSQTFSPPMISVLLQVGLLIILWVLIGKAAEPVLYDRREAAAQPMLPAAEFSLWKSLQAGLRAIHLPAFGSVAASAAEAYATAMELNPSSPAAEECRVLVLDGMLSVIHSGEAIAIVKKKAAPDQDALIQERINEALRAVGLMRTALLRLQKLEAAPKSTGEAARELADLRLELSAMGEET